MPRVLVLLVLAFLSGCGDVLPPAEMQEAPDENVPEAVEFVLVANRGSESLSVIDTKSDAVVQTVALPPAAAPLMVGYVAFSAVHERVYVGDDGNDRIIVLSASDFSHVDDLEMPSDVFHLWHDDDQLWAIDRSDFSVAVFDLATNARLTVVPIPADLRNLGGVPHDVVVDGDNAFVTVLGVTGVPDVVVKFSKTTFAEVGRASVGEDPHVFLHPVDRRLFVACDETDNVFVLNRDTMAELDEIPLLGGHGVWVPATGKTLYVTNFPSHLEGGGTGPAALGLYAVDLDTHTAIGGVSTVFSAPHNITSTKDGSKLYVTHSTPGTKVTVYDLPSPMSAPVYLYAIDVGITPFGLCQFTR